MKNKYLVFAAMGFELVGIILSSVFLGKYIDERYQLKGLTMVILSMLGLASWIFHIVQLAKKLENKND